MKNFNPKIKKTPLIVVLITLVIGIPAYMAANRYLIPHIEIANVSAYSSAAVKPTSTPANPSSTSTAESSAETNEASSTDETVISDDWNYQDSTLSISIKKYTSGSGNNKLTYFVADVSLSDAAQLLNAFANNQFGRNIIAYTSIIAKANDALFAINGDYYGFHSDGIIIRNGVIYRDVPARIGVAFYRDVSMKIYDETATTAEQLLADGVWNTLSFGPALIENGVIAQNLGTIEIDTNFGNHPIQGNQPRTGIGIIDKNHFIFIAVDGRSTGYSRGLTLTEFAEMFVDLGCIDAYNLDGGGSSTMYFQGRVVNNPLGRNKERGTSDILYIGD